MESQIDRAPNERPEVDAGWRVPFAFQRPRSRAAQGIAVPFMRLFILLAASVLCVAAHADVPAYSPMRDWVEKQCATNIVHKDERIFIGHAYSGDYASIVRFQKGITLREIIDRTPFKDKAVYVIVMRPGWMSKVMAIKPSETPDFDVKPLDVVWIYDGIPIF